MSRRIEAATCATASRDGEVRQSKAGNEFVVINLMVQDGSKDGEGKPVTTFVKALGFGPHVAVARDIRKGDRVYCEGQLSASIWRTNDGESRLDLTIKATVLQKTGIGKNRLRYPAPGEKRAPVPEFNDEIGF